MHLVLLLLLQVLHAHSGQVAYVVPEDGRDSCPPGLPCNSLSDIAEDYYGLQWMYFAPETTVFFLPGVHNVSNSTYPFILVCDVWDLAILAAGTKPSSGEDANEVVSIACAKDFSFAFMNVTNLTISGLHFHSCGWNTPRFLRNWTRDLANSTMPEYNYDWTFYEAVALDSAVLYLVHIFHLSISNITIADSEMSGLVIVNVFGDSAVTGSTFVNSHPNLCIVFFDSLEIIPYWDTVFEVRNSTFAFGVLEEPGAGLGVFFRQQSYGIQVKLEKIRSHSNDGGNGGNVYLQSTGCDAKVVATQIHSTNGTCKLHTLPSTTFFRPLKSCRVSVSVTDSFFGNISRHDFQHPCVSLSGLNNMTVEMSDVSISACPAVAVHLSALFSVTFKNTNISGNDGAIVAYETNIVFQGANCFSNNSAPPDSSPLMLYENIVTFEGETVFTGNVGSEGGAIHSTNDILYFKGNVTFLENEAYNGGAIALHAGSELVLCPYTYLYFIGNRAKHYGGGLYVDVTSYPTPQGQIKCFFQATFLLLEFFIDPNNTWGIEVYRTEPVVLTNNSADYAGSVLYGGSIDNCNPRVENGRHIFSVWRFDSRDESIAIFDLLFDYSTDDISPISSDPSRICFCYDSVPNCTVVVEDQQLYPGETFELTVIAAGQRYGSVPHTVYSQLSHLNVTNRLPKLGDLQNRQLVGKLCTAVRYTVISSNSREKLFLTAQHMEGTDAQELHSEYQYWHNNSDSDDGWNEIVLKVPLLVNVELAPCPVGFELSNGSCICASKLQEHKINCNIDGQVIHKPSPLWVGAKNSRVVVHKHCPFDYCKPGNITFSLENPDEQCAFQRSSTLCGGCQPHLSQLLGTSQCGRCSSIWILVLVPTFTLAGVALVVVMTVLNLTVSVGTINGIVFYANIVRANQAVFFPPAANRSPLSVFIAWLNLDIGIQTCFCDGLDAYVKTWLQFVFPFYIWLTVSVIIVASHYTTTAAKLAGRNAVPVLATLFLLSYAKLLRIIITVFSSTTLDYPTGPQMVWLYDGSVPYLRGKHIPLFMAALFVLLLLSIPFTAVLLTIQWIQRLSHLYWLRWIRRLKPLFDAYVGPYRDSHRYWTGLLLLIRAVLFLIFSINTLGNPRVNLLAISVTILCMFLYIGFIGGVYKVWYVNMLEYSCYLNLGVLTTGTLFIASQGRSQRALVNTSVAASCATFLGVVCYHVVLKLTSPEQQQRVTASVAQVMAQVRQGLQTLTARLLHTEQEDGARNRDIVELREPMMEWCA